MSAFKFLKNIFGFSEEDYTSENEQNEHTPYINPFKKEQIQESQDNSAETEETATTSNEITISKSLNDEVIAKIIDILNSGLPEHIKKFIDIEAERQYVEQTFGKTFEQYVESIKDEIEMQAKSQWQADRINMEQRSAALENKAAELKAKNDELRDRIVSLDRQKASFKEQLTQATNKTATAEAERDQFQLECKSLMNKLKVSSVNEDTLNNLKEENSKLLEESNNAKAEMLKLKNLLDSKTKENSELSDKLKSSEENNNGNQAQLIKNLQDEIKKQTDEIYSLKVQLNVAKENEESYQDELSRIQRECEIKDDDINDLQTTISNLEEKINEKDQLAAFLSNNMETQKANEEKLRIQIEQLNDKNEKLEKQLKENRQEKTVLFNEEEITYNKPVKKENKKKSKRTVSAIDYTADYSDWLMPTPPTAEIPIDDNDDDNEEEVVENTSKKATEKKHNSPAQMELF